MNLFFQNMPVERQWVDLNSRVFYPIKRCLIEMEEQSEINLEQSMTKYATSAVSCSLVNIGVQRYIACHNNQHVQGWFFKIVFAIFMLVSHRSPLF